MGMRWRRMLSPLREAAMPSMTASVAAAPSKSSSTAPGGTRSAWRACRKENHCDVDTIQHIITYEYLYEYL
jgi:hypothetical protein